MIQNTQAVSPLRQRMIEDMRLRKLSPKTQSAYIGSVKKLASYLGHSPATASSEELRRFQLDLVNKGVSSIMLNATITALRFLFETTLNRDEPLLKMSREPVPRTLPTVLSRPEVTRLIDAAGHPKYRAALSVAYGAGLRVSEVVALKISDIDSTRMTLRVEQGKGHKDRYAMLSPVLLEHLRLWWHFAHTQGLMLEGGWFFPGQNPVNHLTARQLNRACKSAAMDAEIDKRVSMHILRQFCHSSTGSEGGYTSHSGIAGTQKTGDNGALCTGRHRPFT